MEFFKQDQINIYLAKFKNSKVEQQFHDSLDPNVELFSTILLYFQYYYASNQLLKYYKKRKFPTYLLLLSEIIWAVFDLATGEDQQNQIETLIACSVMLVVFKFAPNRVQQFLIIMSQIYSTYNVQNYLHDYNKLNYNSYATFQVNFQNGMETHNFPLECLSIFANLGINIYYFSMKINSLSGQILMFAVLLSFKYYHNMNQRKLFLAIKNFNQLEKINQIIVSNILIIQRLDNITYEMSLVDCNEKAKKLNIHKNQESYVNYLQTLQIENNSEQNLLKNKISSKQKIDTLKDVMLIKHSQVYEDMMKTRQNIKELKKEKRTKADSDGEIFVLNDDIKVISQNKDNNQKTKYNVKLIPIFINEPLMVICLKDVTLQQNFLQLQTKKQNQGQLYSSLIKFIDTKLVNILQIGQINLKEIQRQLLNIKQILNSVNQFELSHSLSEFSIASLLKQIQKIYEDYPQIEYIFGCSEQIINSNKSAVFSVILAIISSFKPNDIQKIVTKPLQNKFSDTIKIEFFIDNKENKNSEYRKNLNFYNSIQYPQVYEIYQQYFNTLVQKICYNNFYSFEEDIESNQVILSIELIQNLNIVKLSTTNNQTKPQTFSKKQQSSFYININELPSSHITSVNSILINQIQDFNTPTNKDKINIEEAQL